jgi:hypothetical protein
MSCSNWTGECLAVISSGNCATATSVLQIVDRTRPVLQNLPENITVQCGAVPAPAAVTATDNCGLMNLTMQETRQPGLCPNEYVLLRTWTAIDFCGNSASYTQRIIVIDTLPPTADQLPNLGPYQCPGEVPPMNASLAELRIGRGQEACDANFTITAREDRLPGRCVNEFTLIRHFTASDCSGNAVTINRTITVNDTTAPVLSGVPADTSMPCDNVTGPPTVTGLDNCDLSVPVQYSEQKLPGRCTGEYTLLRSWTAVDACGNRVNASQRIAVFDRIAPVFVNPPGPLNGTCLAVPSAQDLSATDNCGPVNVTMAETRQPGACDNSFGVSRTWTACDDWLVSTSFLLPYLMHVAYHTSLSDCIIAVVTAPATPSWSAFLTTRLLSWTTSPLT